MILPVVHLLFSSGCGTQGAKNKNNEQPNAYISGPSMAMVGDTVVFTGSLDDSGSGVSFLWELYRAPEGAQATLSGEEGETIHLIPDVPGIWVIWLTVDYLGNNYTASHTLLVHEPSLNAVFVNCENQGDEDGTLARPFATLQAAVDAAEPGDAIRIATCVYRENVVIPPTRGLSLLGGYPADFSVRDPRVNPVHVQGNGTGPVIAMHYAGDTGDVQLLRVDGLTVSGGERGILVESIGNGGILSVVLHDNIIENNHGLTGSNDYGGGILVRGVVPEITHNTIRNNTCGKGAGLAVQLHTPEYAIRIENNVIEDNAIFSDHGGGVAIMAVQGIIRNNVIRRNRILEGWGWGGGMLVDGNRFEGFHNGLYLELSGNIYTENESPSAGSGLFIDEGANVRMHHELIVRNHSSDGSRNGALYVDGPRANGQAITVVENCTIADNTGGDGSLGHAILVEGDSEVRVVNSIFWNNRSDNRNDFHVQAGSSLHVSYSLYDDGCSGEGTCSLTYCIQADPLFADPDVGDYHLQSLGGRWDPATETWVIDTQHSPAIDAGDPVSPYQLETAPNGGRVNLGAYGNTPLASRSRP